MKLSIENLAKIASADFEFNGITVIVGDNNTGKSTAGKVLYALFTALSKLPERIKSLRYSEMKDALRKIASSFFRRYRVDLSVFLDKTLTAENVTEILKKDFDLNELRSEDLNSLAYKLLRIRDLSDITLVKRIIENCFASIFDSQYKSLIGETSYPVIKLQIEDSSISVLLAEEIDYKQEVDLYATAYLLSGTATLNRLSSMGYGFYSHSYVSSLLVVSDSEERLALQIRDFHNKRKGVAEQLAAEDVILQEDLNEISKLFESVVHGKLLFKGNGEFKFFSNELNSELSISNLSEGLKTFALLQLIVGSGILKRKDVLILDEPEVHLHPDWQLKYAELIVLLQKHFDLTVLLTSHSSDFIYALQLYARKYKTDSCVNAYISQCEDEAAVFTKVEDDNWDDIYAKFIPMMNRLRELEKEINTENRED